MSEWTKIPLNMRINSNWTATSVGFTESAIAIVEFTSDTSNANAVASKTNCRLDFGKIMFIDELPGPELDYSDREQIAEQICLKVAVQMAQVKTSKPTKDVNSKYSPFHIENFFHDCIGAGFPRIWDPATLAFYISNADGQEVVGISEEFLIDCYRYNDDRAKKVLDAEWRKLTS